LRLQAPWRTAEQWKTRTRLGCPFHTTSSRRGQNAQKGQELKDMERLIVKLAVDIYMGPHRAFSTWWFKKFFMKKC
jgi:hypothetical protein